MVMGLVPNIQFDRIKQWLRPKRPPIPHCCEDPQTRGRFVHHDLAAHKGVYKEKEGTKWGLEHNSGKINMRER